MNSTVPGNPLHKKSVALSYYFFREHSANGVVKIMKIKSEDNYSDPFTKGMHSTDLGEFFHNVMHN